MAHHIININGQSHKYYTNEDNNINMYTKLFLFAIICAIIILCILLI